MSDNPSPGRPDDIGRLIEWLDSRALPVLERIAQALERAPLVVPGSHGTSPTQTDPISALRLALKESRWVDATELFEELGRTRPDDPQVAALGRELDRGRHFAAEDLRLRIDAARQANDPDGAVSARDELRRIAPSNDLGELDRQLAKWLMAIIQRRMRTGTLQAEVVHLAGRVAESFAATVEGASLSASLPTLRRASGLCPRCAEPYTGVADACPKCLAASATPATLAQPFAAEDDLDAIETEDDLTGEPLDLNNERFWQIP